MRHRYRASDSETLLPVPLPMSVASAQLVPTRTSGLRPSKGDGLGMPEFRPERAA
jgi:hypothetical protein